MDQFQRIGRYLLSSIFSTTKQAETIHIIKKLNQVIEIVKIPFEGGGVYGAGGVGYGARGTGIIKEN